MSDETVRFNAKKKPDILSGMFSEWDFVACHAAAGLWFYTVECKVDWIFLKPKLSLLLTYQESN